MVRVLKSGPRSHAWNSCLLLPEGLPGCKKLACLASLGNTCVTRRNDSKQLMPIPLKGCYALGLLFIAAMCWFCHSTDVVR